MFDPNTAAEVVIKPFDADDAYHEWRAPKKSPLFAGGRNECFIEAVTGQRFVVEVVLHPLFSFKGCQTVGVDCAIDGEDVIFDDIERPAHGRREPLHLSLTSFSRASKDETRVYGMTFAELSVVDDSSLLSVEEQELELNRRGKIVVVLQRGRLLAGKKRRRTHLDSDDDDSDDSDLPAFPHETTKLVAMDNGKSHFVKMDILHTSPWSRSDRSGPTFKEADGDAGEEIKFVFYYSSRMFLECKAIMPLIPYPNTAEEPITVEQDGAAPTRSSDTHPSLSGNNSSVHSDGNFPLGHGPSIGSNEDLDDDEFPWVHDILKVSHTNANDRDETSSTPMPTMSYAGSLQPPSSPTPERDKVEEVPKSPSIQATVPEQDATSSVQLRTSAPPQQSQSEPISKASLVPQTVRQSPANADDDVIFLFEARTPNRSTLASQERKRSSRQDASNDHSVQRFTKVPRHSASYASSFNARTKKQLDLAELELEKRRIAKELEDIALEKRRIALEREDTMEREELDREESEDDHDKRADLVKYEANEEVEEEQIRVKVEE